MGSFHDSSPFKVGERYYMIMSVGPFGIGPNKNPFSFSSYSFWHLFESEDVQSGWEYAGDFIDRQTCALYSRAGEDGACNHIHGFGDGQYLLIWGSHRLGLQYFIGPFDSEAKQFKPHSYARLGSAQGRVHRFCATGVAKEQGTVNVVAQVPYHGLLAPEANSGLPPGNLFVNTQVLKFSLDEKKRLLIRPAPGTESLRDRHQQVQPCMLKANTETVFPELAGVTKELNMEIDPRSALSIRISVRRSLNGEESTDLVFYPNIWTMGDDKEFAEAGRPWNRYLDFFGTYGAFVFDTQHSSLAPNRLMLAPQTIELEPWAFAKRPLNLRIFIDHSLIEVFINDRKFGATTVWPTRGDSVGVTITAMGGDAFLNSAESWDMKSIWTDETTVLK
jgi:beta-fructofuranosidase